MAHFRITNIQVTGVLHSKAYSPVDGLLHKHTAA